MVYVLTLSRNNVNSLLLFQLFDECRKLWRKGKRSGLVEWKTFLNDKHCIFKVTQKRYKDDLLHSDYGPT